MILPNPLLRGASVAAVTFGIAVGFMSRARLNKLTVVNYTFDGRVTIMISE